MVSSQVKIGTAGFGYKDWLGNFYPQFCPQADFLRYYGTRFSVVELDVTFYRIPSDKMVARWAQVTPEGFRFAAKFPRTVTHEGDISNRLAQAEAFVSVMRGLGDKLGPMLLQFPGSFRPDSGKILKALVDELPIDLQFCIELRSPAWLCDDLYKWLGKRGLALCLIDYPGMPRLSVKTADFSYVRFLGDHREMTEDFSYIRNDREDELQVWGEIIRNLGNDRGEIYGFVNNHYSGHAPTTAYRLIELLNEET